MSGAHAREHGLVDAIGGPLEALAMACERAGLARGERYALDVLPRGPGFGAWPWLRGFGGSRAEPGLLSEL